MRSFVEFVQFDWDKGNSEKNFQKHRVSTSESEEVFFDKSKIILKTSRKTYKEKRDVVIGKTKNDRLLFIVYTYRQQMIRVISARDAHKNERKIYEKTTHTS